MNNKVWINKEIDNSITKSLSDRYGFSGLCASVLQNRPEIADGNYDNLFRRVLYNLNNPFLLNDMDKAVERIERAIIRGEKITIFGDYDADGITSTSILYMFLRENGADVAYFVPNRFSGGYGMNNETLSNISKDGTKLIITVDNGISALEEVEYAKTLGMDVVVTDHHECGDKLPDCCAVVNPKRADSTYPYSNLAGVGVTFKLICALNKNSLESAVKKYILLTAIGTLADVVPLTGENRAIVTMGLKMIPYNKNCGIDALIKTSGISQNASVSDVSFGLVPRINAAGRMDDATVCVRLFSSDNVAECSAIANRLNDLNAKRQDVEKQITDEAFAIIEEQRLYNNNIICVYHEGWNHGVIGIVASRICEKYYKPTIVMTDDDGYIKGSGRSVKEFDLYEALSVCRDCLYKFGGHSMAAGVLLEKCKYDDFCAKINDFAGEKLDGESFLQKIYIDANLNDYNIDIELAKGLEILEPYGTGNPKPVFSILNVRVLGKSLLSDGKHIKLVAEHNGRELELIGFSMGEFAALISENDLIDVAGCLDINSFRGVCKVQIILKDIKRIRKK